MTDLPLEPEEREAEEVEPEDAPDPEEYTAEEDATVSESTGTVYEVDGEPAETPSDAEPDEDDEE